MTFFAPDKEKCGAFLRAQKNVAEKNRAEGEARTRFFVARAAQRAAKLLLTCYAPLVLLFYYKK